jgi:isopentenyl phosphate kinase
VRLRPLVVVKLGGSVLTNKGSKGRARFEARRAARLARQLAPLLATRRLVVVLGAGSWGHPLAARHRIGRRVLRGAQLLQAFTEIGASVADLQSRFVRAAQEQSVPCVSVSAGANAFFVRGRLRFDDGPIQRLVNARLVPIIGGDVVLDDRTGLRILSGDRIVAEIAKRQRAERVVFASDVPGVLDGERVLARMTAAGLRRRLPTIDRGGDATGGMRGKLEAALTIVERGVPVWIVDGRDATSLGRAVRGEAVGTRIVPR